MRHPTHQRAWWAQRAWLPGGVAERVVMRALGDRFSAITAGTDPPADAVRLHGLVLPGLANAHSHAFHRALRGRTETGSGDFWTWRTRMYELAARLDPDGYHALARAVYAEMALAGITAVGEFHYLHHAPGGHPYAQPNAMGAALAAAADEAGLRLTLVDTCYLRGGFDAPLRGPQLRFGDADADAWARRASDAATGLPGVRVAAGAHSVRTVPPQAMAVVAGWAAERDAPLHLHLSEQRGENDACMAATGRTPAALADDHGLLGRRATAVHATHVTADDVKRIGSSATAVCVCPTTERSLADGVGPAAALRDAGSPLCVGSDSHAVVDLFEEARAVELDERLVSGRRGHHRPEALLRAVTAGGAAALGWDAGTLATGQLADFVAVDTAGVRLAGAGASDLAAHVVFAATSADVTHVVVGGRTVVDDRAHVRVGDVGRALTDAIREVTGP